MELEYAVHSVAEEHVTVEVSFNGRPMPAQVPALVVELVRENHAHTFRWIVPGDEDMAAARALFAMGAKVKATFTAVDA